MRGPFGAIAYILPFVSGLLTVGVCRTVTADLVTVNVSFSANSFQVGTGGNPPPADPVVGSFLLTYDPNVEVVNSTTGITMTTLNIALGSQAAWTYKPNADGPFGAGTLRVGGLANGADAVQFNPSTNDFWLYITDFASAPTFQQLGYSQAAVSGNNLFFTVGGTGSVSVSVVPEPSSMVVLGALTAVACCLRRKR